MIELTVKEVMESVGVLNEIMEQPFHGALAFKISRIIRELRKEVESFNTERDKIIRVFSEKDENGKPVLLENGNIKIRPDLVKECNDEFEKLLGTSIEINAEKLTLKDMDEIEITPKKMESILVLVKGYEE